MGDVVGANVVGDSEGLAVGGPAPSYLPLWSKGDVSSEGLEGLSWKPPDTDLREDASLQNNHA